MIFLYVNIASFDHIGAAEGALIENDAYFAQPYLLEENKVEEVEYRYFCGEPLYNVLKDSEFDIYPLLRVSSNASYLPLSLIIIDSPIMFRDNLISPPSLDNIVITDFASSLLIDEKEITIAPYISGTLGLQFDYTSFEVENIVPCDYDEIDRQRFLSDPNYANTNSDKFICEYSLGFISSETFTKLKNSSQLRLSASNFFLSEQTTREYANSSLYYDLYSENNLLAGRAPVEDSEVVISSRLFENNKISAGFDNIEDCLEKEFSYKDLNLSPNKDLYQGTMNLFDLNSKIKIVGVTSDDTSHVYVSSSFMNRILDKADLYLGNFLIDIKSGLDNLSKADKGNVFYNFGYLVPIMTMKNLISSDFFYILLGAIIIVLISTVTFLVLTFTMNVKEKYKEIAILKSFGTSRNSINSLFFVTNYFIAAVSIILGLTLSITSLHLVNNIFMSPTVFNINYSIINIVPISFIIVILVTLVSALISTIFALMRVSKIDVALVLKMY